MEMALEEMILAGALLAFIGLLVMYVRAEDDPKTPWSKEFMGIHLGVFVSSMIAAALAAWIFDYDVMTPEGFVAIVGVAGTGLAFLKGLVNRPA